MSGPRHLWSGEWERDSEAAARERAARGGVPASGDAEPPKLDVPRPRRPQAEPARAPQQPKPSPQPSRAPRQPLPPRTRGLLLVAAVVAVLAAGVWALGELTSSGGPVPQRAFGSAWLGLRLGVLPAGAVVVRDVAHDSPADQAGIHNGDVITEIEGRPVAAPVDVNEAIDALRAGDRVEIQVVRGASTLTFGVKLTSRPSGTP